MDISVHVVARLSWLGKPSVEHLVSSLSFPMWPNAQDEENRPAMLDDLLEGEDLRQRLQEEGKLQEMLEDPLLLPDWNAQFAAQQGASSI